LLLSEYPASPLQVRLKGEDSVRKRGTAVHKQPRERVANLPRFQTGDDLEVPVPLAGHTVRFLAGSNTSSRSLDFVAHADNVSLANIRPNSVANDRTTRKVSISSLVCLKRQFAPINDGFAVLLSARQLALLPIVPGRFEANFASIPKFILASAWRDDSCRMSSSDRLKS